MDSFPAHWESLFAVVFALGARHGIDADHLATIDGLARFNGLTNPRLARWSGILFSAGHGLVVTVVAVVVGLLAARWEVPSWMDTLGTWISIVFLLLLGTLNLMAVVNAKRGQLVEVVGVRARWLSRTQRADNPMLIILVGALFALSFDTMSQTTLFALAGAQQGGIWHTAALGIGFTSGMMLADGLNGLWISHVLSRTDSLAHVASRIMGLTVACISFAVAAIGIGKVLSPGLEAWFDSNGYILPFCVMTMLVCAFVFALLIASRTKGVAISGIKA